MSVCGPTNKFLYDRIHDQYLYYLTLEAAIFNSETQDYIYNRGGAIRMAGGWESVARNMTKVFGRKFTPGSVHTRYNKFSKQDEYLSTLFDEVILMRDQIEFTEEVMNA